VLDTWFSSALWPFSTLGWPEQTDNLRDFYPTSVLVTGFDIIFFWVARMIMMGLKFTGKIPFKEVYFHGLIRDSEGNKMSKTKGNVLDPLDLIDGVDLETLVKKRTSGLMQPWMAEKIEEKTRKEFPAGITAHGTDALRFTFCAFATTGRDIRFDMNRLDGYRNFCNKIWNAARYVFMQVEGSDLKGALTETRLELSLADKWIQSRLQHTILQTRNHLDSYRFDLASQALYEFVWHEFCDWYLELSKPVLISNSATMAEKLGTRKTLITVLDNILKLMHPMMPFITEEIWQQLKPYISHNTDSIMLAAFPAADNTLVDSSIEAEVTWLQQVIIGIRNIRGEMNISPAKQFTVLISKASDLDKKRFAANNTFLLTLAKLSSIEIISTEFTETASTALIGEMELLIPLKGLVDVTQESARLSKEIEKLTKDAKRYQAKLGNAKFIDNAPTEVVAEEKRRQEEVEAAMTKLQTKLEQIKSL
jgi:valyl-tRNA synthetase